MVTTVESTLTYDQARDWALDALGFGGACPVEPEIVEVLMSNCLGQVYSQVWNNKYYQNIWNFEVKAGLCYVQIPNPDYDPEIEDSEEFIEACTGDIFQPMYRIVNKLERDSDCKELWEADCFPTKCDPVAVNGSSNTTTSYPTKEELVTKWEDKGKIKEVTQTSVLGGYEEIKPKVNARCEWYCWGDKFVISPASTTDQTFTMYGYRRLDATLYVVDDVDPNKIIWQKVDLPEEFQTAFQKCLLGFLYAQCGDTDLAREWLRIASDEINAIVQMNDGQATDRTPNNDDGLPCYMNGGARREGHCPPPRFHFEELDGDLQRGIW